MQFDEERGRYFVDGNAFVGLRRTLQRVCFPDYNYKQSLDDCPQDAAQHRATGLSRPSQGRRRGSIVHKQLQTLVNSGDENALCDARGRRGVAPHRCVEQVLRFLRFKGLVPIAAEFGDFYEDMHMASEIDLICYSPKKRKVALVELKVGGDNYFKSSNKPLRDPPLLRTQPNSPLTQAYLQLLFYRKMFTDHYPHVPLGTCYVLQACNDRVCCYRLPSLFVDAQQQLYDCLAAARASAAAQSSKRPRGRERNSAAGKATRAAKRRR